MNEQLAKEVLLECLKTGGDFAEIYVENRYDNNLRMLSGKIDQISTNQTYGVGIRILKGLEEVYGHCSDLSKESLLKLASSLASSYNEEQKIHNIEFNDYNVLEVNKFNRLSKDIKNDEKIKYLQICNDAIVNYSPLIVQTITSHSDFTQEVQIINSNGVFKSDVRNNQRIFAQAVCNKDGNMQSHGDSYGGNFSFDHFESFDFNNFATEIAKKAVLKLDACDMVGGVYDVIINDAFGGVIFHEACGHSLEATSVARGMSVFCDKLGEQIASSCVTAIDDGTIANEWGSLNVDDEGTETKKNVLIENGILKSYLVDYRNTRRMNHSVTGSGRRESYKYSPTSRMTNTYIANGQNTVEEIIASTKNGLYAAQMGGGSVNPVTGEFNFSVSEGYMIEDGKITTSVKGATLIGNGKETLLNIDMVANNQSFGYGMCGSKSGSIPTCVGQPTIRVKGMTVGGNGGKN